ncbi:MAG: alpha/beta fold hydrolase [Deltaproteobacteria bacterium]|nr:alpha/beta fold hydrolase [Deltaproteobacteria bacterium]
MLELGRFRLTRGGRLANAKLVYKTYGKLAEDRSNVILYPTSYGAHHSDIDWLVRPGGILDSEKWFVVIANMFGNGLSSSPSHGLDPGITFTHDDNLRAQETLLTQGLGVQSLKLVYGWSMGAQQAYYWAVKRPHMVERFAAICGTAQTTPHNTLFLRSLEAALQSDPAWDGTRFNDVPRHGIRTFAFIYASWAASQAFYRERLYESLGYVSLDDYVKRAWEEQYLRRDPMNLLCMLRTWMCCDVAEYPEFNGDLRQALKAITARALIMPSATDLYFTPEDCRAEADMIRGSTYLPIPSIWGHRAGNPFQNPADEAFLREAVHNLLERPAKGART